MKRPAEKWKEETDKNHCLFKKMVMDEVEFIQQLFSGWHKIKIPPSF